MTKLVLVLGLLLTAIDPLRPDEATRLATARDGGDHREEAFAALVENATRWTDAREDEPIRRHPDLDAMADDPPLFRGELCRVAGVIQQQAILPAPQAGVREWFLRDDGTRPCIVYVVGDVQPPTIRDGTRVVMTARFYKTITLPARDGVPRVYPAFVGAHPAVPRGGGASRLLPVAAVVLVLLVTFVVVLAWTRRRGAAPSSVPLASAPETLDEGDALPDDPADALAEMRRRAAASREERS